MAGVFAIGFAGLAIDRAAGRAELGLSRGDTVERHCEEMESAALDDAVGHVILSGCEMHLMVSSVVFSGPDLVAAYVPLQVAGRPALVDSPLLYRSEDPMLMERLTEFIRTNPDAPDAWLRARVDADPGTIDGTLLRGRHATVADAEHLERHRTHLAADAVVLVDRRSLPSPLPALGMALLLAALAVWGLVFPPSGILAGTGLPRGSSVNGVVARQRRSTQAGEDQAEQ